LFEGRPLSVGPANFDKHRRKNDIAVLVEVWAPWCGPCRAMALMFEKAAAELRPGVRLIKLNADYEPRIASELGSRAFLLCCCCAADGLWPERQADGYPAHRRLDAHASRAGGLVESLDLNAACALQWRAI
jgi:thiol-disulfide isomerase/thioredoxin